MLTYLYQNYGIITPNTLEDNDKKIRAPHDPPLPIEILYKQIEDALEFADATNTPYWQEQVLLKAYVLVFASGAYPDACKEWRNMNAQEKTWNNFKTHFSKAQRDVCLQAATVQNAGFQANAIQEQFNLETVEAIQNLVNANISDRNAVATLIQTNVTLSTQLATANADIIAQW